MEFVSILVLLGITQAAFIGLLLFTKKSGNRKANKIFGLLFFNLSISALYYYFYSSNLFLKYPHLQKTTFPAAFLYGPLLYFYVKVQTDNEYKFRRNSAFHFIPFLLVIASNMPFYLESAEYKLNYLNQRGIYKDALVVIQSFAQILHSSIYIIATKIIIARHVRTIKKSLSLIENASLRWLSVAVNYIIAIFTAIIIHLFLIYFGVDLSSIYHISVPVLITIFIFTFGYYGLRQPEIKLLPETADNDKKYERSTLTPAKSEIYLRDLINLMETQKPFLEPDLTLMKLSERAGIAPHHLSQIINEKLNQNFYDFINKYRVETAKNLLKDPSFELKTIYAIALESGFNSKSAFNSCFKKYSKITPSEFKKKHSASSGN